MRQLRITSPVIRPYYVSRADCNPDEPSPGWYYVSDRGDVEEIHGPFSSRREAIMDGDGGELEAHEDDEYRERRLRADE